MINMEEGKTEDIVIEERKRKVMGFLKKTNVWAVFFLIIALILGIYIRSLPMMNHEQGPPSFLNFISSPGEAFKGRPGLWDITKNTWSLGPDLDPWLFLRSAKTIAEQGSLPKIDTMRNVPLGFDNSIETKLLPNMIFWTYSVFHYFNNNVNVDFAGVVFPVIMFFFTIISFFLFVREIFIRKTEESKIQANLIALISTFLMIVTPAFLSRTVAGIPEKESAAFFFVFLVFYFFLKSWKSEKMINSVIFAILAGLSTMFTGLIWGGVFYVFIPMGLANLLAFLLNKINKKELIGYGSWLVSSFFLFILFSNKYNIKSMLTSIDTGMCFLVLVIMSVHIVLWGTGLSNIKLVRESKLPKNITSSIIALLLLLIFVIVFLGPSFIIDKIKVIHETIFRPVSGRWNVTVAENRQPFFNEWAGSFGPFIKNIPILFWLFFIGSVILFRKTFNKINKKDAWILTFLFAFFLFGLIFSRYAPHPNILDGEGFISKMIYYGSALLLIGFTIYYFIAYYKKQDKSFEETEFPFLLLLSLFVFILMTVRGAIRLTMVLVPAAVIFPSYMLVEAIYKFRKTKEETLRLFLGVAVVVLAILIIFTFWTFYNQIRGESFSFVPSYYNQQWQKAMQWVRNETPEDAVFAHWWDYGYWLQSIGDRATVLDGGNAKVFWNYYMGRFVLTGDNQKDSLDFLYAHDANYLLIDSTDIGKYGAFSSIGSDKDFDRYSWIGNFMLDEKQTQETNNQTLLVYMGGIGLDEDLLINENGREILLPGQKAGVAAIIVPMEKVENGTTFAQPYALVIYQGIQHKVNLRYLSIYEEFIDFKTGTPGCLYVFPTIIQEGQSVTQNPVGASMFLSPRLMRGFLAQKYILNDPFKKFPNFKIAHIEDSLFVANLKSQGMKLPNFVYFNGIQGPITIWKIEYPKDQKLEEEYLETDSSKYLSWKL